MWKHLTFCIIVALIPRSFGQTTPSSNATTTNSPQDIYDLNEEDFQLWLSGRMPKAWESTTRTTTSTSTSTTTSRTTQSSLDEDEFLKQFDDLFDQRTTSRPEFTVTPSPESTTISTPNNDLSNDGYFYPRPDSLQNFLQAHTLPSKQINNQLMENVNTLPFPPRYGAAAPDCIPASQVFNHRDGSISYQTFATVHRFHGNTPQVSAQAQPQPHPQQPQPQPPFPGSSHHGDAFLSQHQQKPQQQYQQQQPQLPRPAVAPLPQHGHRVSEFYGHPLFVRPQVSYAPAYETPVLLNYF